MQNEKNQSNESKPNRDQHVGQWVARLFRVEMHHETKNHAHKTPAPLPELP